jgi:TrmH family RNA methyltransferase
MASTALRQAGAMTVRLEGFHAVKHALRFAPDLLESVTVRDLPAALALAEQLAPDIAAALRSRAQVGVVEHPTGVEAVASRPAEDCSALGRRRSPLVVLDDPKRPGNIGAVIRVAAAAGASGVAVVGSVDPWHPAVLRGSAGLHYALPVLSVAPDDIAGPLVVLDAAGDELRAIPDDAALVVGSERVGVSPALRARADLLVRLPMREGVSSLNLATATAAVLYVWRLEPMRSDPKHPHSSGSRATE